MKRIFNSNNNEFLDYLNQNEEFVYQMSNRDKFVLINSFLNKGFSLNYLAKILKVNRCSYYYYKKNPTNNREEKKLALENFILKVHREYPFLGYRSIHEMCLENSFKVSDRTVWKICKQNNIKAHDYR